MPMCKGQCRTGAGLLIVLVASSLFASAQQTETTPAVKAGPQAVFTPGPDFLISVHKSCDGLESKEVQDCFAKEMKKAGASPAAAEYSKQLGEPGYLREFKAVGPVDFAYALYVYRANESQSCLLVNGNPTPIDVDNQKLLEPERLKSNATFARMLKTIPKLTLWPGDRGSAKTANVERTPDGGAKFVVNYALREGCHSCAIRGTAWYAFAFDRNGDFLGTTVAGVSTASNKKGKVMTTNATDAAKPVSANQGEEFEIRIPSNPTTGYSWEVSSPADPNKVRVVKRNFEPAREQVPGAGGQDVWTFGALAPGQTDLEFAHKRSWEGDEPPEKTLKFKIVVRGQTPSAKAAKPKS